MAAVRAIKAAFPAVEIDCEIFAKRALTMPSAEAYIALLGATLTLRRDVVPPKLLTV
jgi:hypothetical protein